MGAGNSPLVLDATQVQDASLGDLGGKAASLARLAAHHLPVPPFLVVTPAGLEAHLRYNRIRLPDADPGIAEEAGTLASLIAGSPLPPDLVGAVQAAHRKLIRRAGHQVVAVRSSGAAEDSAAASFAGLFHSELGVTPPQLPDALRRCWASSVSARAAAYRRSRGLAAGVRPDFAVVIQVQVFAERAGVLFTRHPLEPAGELAYLESNFGTGESVVAGAVGPDGFAVSRTTLEIRQASLGSKRTRTVVTPEDPAPRVVDNPPAQRSVLSLSPDQVRGLVQLGLQIEGLTGGPTDVEWAIDLTGPWILQARPQTAMPPGGAGGD